MAPSPSPSRSGSRKRRSRCSSSTSTSPAPGDSILENAADNGTDLPSEEPNDPTPKGTSADEGGQENAIIEVPRLSNTQEDNEINRPVTANVPPIKTEEVQQEPAGQKTKASTHHFISDFPVNISDEESKSDDKVQRVQIVPERIGWARLADLVRLKHTEKVTDIKEDIDTLLVFAGLFSAVITAFIIESYKNLQQQPEDMTVQILAQISAQLAGLSLNGNIINSTIPTPPPFRPPRFTVPINTLWSLSLVIALITASFGILVKQWFHEYLARNKHDPKEQLKVHFYRDAGMKRWRVFEIAAFLPLLLQLALLLFFTGLGLFLHDLDPVVGWITTGLMLTWLALFLSMTAMPAFSAQCPYKTPMLNKILSMFRLFWVSRPQWILAHIWPNIQAIRESWRFTLPPFDEDYVSPTWRDRFYLSVKGWKNTLETYEEGNVSKAKTLDIPVVLCARDILQGEKLTETTTQCFRETNISQLFNLFGDFNRKHDHVERGFVPDMPEDKIGATREFFETVLVNDRILGEINKGDTLALFILYRQLSSKFSGWYVPPTDHLILTNSMTITFIQLIQADPSSAAFSFLTMYSIRHRTLTDHPNSFDFLFEGLSDSERLSHGIGVQFLSNLVTAAKSLIHSIWKQPQAESDDRKIQECVEAIRINADEFDPVRSPDPIAFIYVFAIVLVLLVPEDVVQRRKDEIYEVMGELAEIVVEEDASSWIDSRKECLGCTHTHFAILALSDLQLIPKLINLYIPIIQGRINIQ